MEDCFGVDTTASSFCLQSLKLLDWDVSMTFSCCLRSRSNLGRSFKYSSVFDSLERLGASYCKRGSSLRTLSSLSTIFISRWAFRRFS